MRTPTFRLLLTGLLLSGALVGLRAQEPVAAPASVPKVLATELPTGERWLTHFRTDLLPFWDMPDAWGSPRGDFPTFRCNDGHLLDPEHPCAELAAAPGWIKAQLGREYVRMKSRQIYFYGVAYHLTGDPKMLALARDGVNFIRANALDKATGSAVSYWEKGVPGPPVLARTSQDLAYAQLGMAMYYYLTRDEAVLKDILKLKNHIFKAYWDDQWGMLRWVAKSDEVGEEARQELVAQLDQINAYMLLLTPILPKAERLQWEQELRKLARLMIAKFYVPEKHLFWGSLHDPKDRVLGSRHTDFGHTTKALWMIERIGRLTGDQPLIDFATTEAKQVLAMAYLPATGSWGSRLERDGSVSPYKEWWIYAELDQTAATLALADPAQAKALPATWEFWFKHLVDPVNHEVYGGTTPDGEPFDGPKIHHWKSGYHSAEHALVGYLTAQALHGEPATLWFAPKSPKALLRPYVFAGVAGNREASALPGFPGRRRWKVSFTELR